MAEIPGNTLNKNERLSGKKGISTLMSDGRRGGTQHFRYFFIQDNGTRENRILVSVPKRHFKRAVKRNLLKRRIREAYRTNKALLNKKGTDMMFVYTSDDIISSDIIREEVVQILKTVDSKTQQ